MVNETDVTVRRRGVEPISNAIAGKSNLIHDSPLRYPGGKASLAPLLAKTIELNNLRGCSYFEPFAGGAGAALRLLRNGIVSELYLNDYDPRITAFWEAILNDTERFVEAIRSVPLSIDEWKKQKQTFLATDCSKPFDIGFATFYLNRCNRSGVLCEAGPIGGYEQKGRWGIGARFNREGLVERILAISRKRDQIQVSNMDALKFLVQCLPLGNARKHVFVYLDPPYYSNGNRLYLNFYKDRDHTSLARYVQRQKILHWVMSYDDVGPIRRLYDNCAITTLQLRYSLQRKQRAHELLIAPFEVQLPTCNFKNVRFVDDVALAS